MASARAADTSGETVCIEVAVCDADTAEILSAEAFEAGTVGIEEREAAVGIRLLLYVPAAADMAVRAAIASAIPSAHVGPSVPVVEADWSEQWKLGLTAVEISDRLVVRPSFVERDRKSGEIELVIDPGQAFGTGGHPSTQLTLEWIDLLQPALEARETNWQRLDVGTGTGVLSLAALKFGARSAIGFDLDPLAIQAARANAQVNGIDRGLGLFVGPLDAVAEVPFDLIVANLLRTELMPLIDGIANRVRPGGHAVFAGLLRGECDTVIEAASAAGLSEGGRRDMPDANGEIWSALLTTR